MTTDSTRRGPEDPARRRHPELSIEGLDRLGESATAAAVCMDPDRGQHRTADTWDISQGWLLSWRPDPVLGRWRQLLGNWAVEGGAMRNAGPSTAKIVANVEPEGDYIWESVIRIEGENTIACLIACFLEDRGAYCRIVFEPGKPVRAYYALYDESDAEPLTVGVSNVQSGVDCIVRVVVTDADVEVSLDGCSVGRFADPRLRGRMAGFLVHRGGLRIRSVRIVGLEDGAALFQDDFADDSLARTTTVEPEDLVAERWVPAVVPGTVQTALLEAGVIEDPYVGYNGPKQRWVDRQRWIYRRTFALPAEWSDRSIELVFHGIDYHGYIWLNGELLAYHEGMLRARSIDISQRVRRSGENELLVCLLPCPTPPHSNVKPYILQRWHFNMDILTVGLWRPVQLRAFGKVRLLDPQVVTERLEDGDAWLRISFTIASSAELYPVGPSGVVRIQAPDSADVVAELCYSTGYLRGAQRQEFRIRVPNARLWWPNGMGDQPRYRMRVEVWDVPQNRWDQESPTDSIDLQFGIRTVEMRPTPEGLWRYNWTFTVNGRPFFGKGANWMPVDQMLRLDRGRYEKLLYRAVDANINILRPWGGGLLETDDFYDLCDQLGVCVWQEFPLANGLFHMMDEDVLRDTVVQNVKRLRNRPSLVLWCGGNEFDADNPWNRPLIDMVECLCRELDPSREFHRASPYGGDSHSYQVNWDGGANYTYFTRDLSPAITEFSMASPPAVQSLRKVIPEPEMEAWPPKGPDPLEQYEIPGWDPTFRQRESAFSMHDAHLAKAFAKMMPFISDCGVPGNWEEFVEYAQVGQGILTRFGLDFWRSRWPYCTVTMGWCLNVIWPSSMTWEYIDWFGVPKASYYDYQQAYEPLHVGAVFDELFTPPGADFGARLFVANDTDGAFPEAVVDVRLYDAGLNRLTAEQFECVVRPRTTGTVGFLTWRAPTTAPDQVLFLRVDLLGSGDGRLLSRSVYTPRVGMPAMRMPYLREGPWISSVRDAPTDLQLSWMDRWRRSNDGWHARLRLFNAGDRPAYRARVYCPEHDHDLRYSSNHLWIEPAEEALITVRSPSQPPQVLLARAWNAAFQELPA